jgi:1-deoxy-D-xylulose-5-phosphate synthase
LEDHALSNGFGTSVLESATTLGLPTTHVTRLGHPERLIGHATRAQQLAEAGLDAAGIALAVRESIRRVKALVRNPAAAL